MSKQKLDGKKEKEKDPENSIPENAIPENIESEQKLEKDKENENEIKSKSVSSAESLYVLALYMKGQKVLYMEAKSHCERRLNWLMLPAILNSAICTVISSALHDWAYGSILLASLSAFNSCVLAIISYLKLDAKCEAHRSSAFQFERLQNLCEFHAGKFLFGIGAKEYDNNFGLVLSEIETKMKEIKDSNQFMLPKTVRNRYPTIYTTNVFAIVRSAPEPMRILEKQFQKEMVSGLGDTKYWFFEICKTHSNRIIPDPV